MITQTTKDKQLSELFEWIRYSYLPNKSVGGIGDKVDREMFSRIDKFREEWNV